MKLVLIGMAAFAAAAPLPGPNWYRVADGPNDLYFVDRSSVSRTGDQIRAEVLYTDPSVIEPPFSIDVTFDCAARTSTLHSVQNYALLGSGKDGPRGPFPGPKVQDAIGVEAVMLDRLCTNKAWSEPVTDPFVQIQDERIISVQGCRPPENARKEVCLRKNRR